MHSQFSFDEMKSRYAVERRQPCQIIRADDQVPLMAQTRSAGMSAMPPLLGDKRTSRGEPISVAIDPGCVKTRRRSIAIEQVTRSRPFHVPTSEAHSILKSKSRISFSSRFEFLSFHTAWTQIGSDNQHSLVRSLNSSCDSEVRSRNRGVEPSSTAANRSARSSF